jgi:hypothetical protein
VTVRISEVSDPQVPHVPYGGPNPDVQAGAPPPRWLRRLFDNDAVESPPAGVHDGLVLLAEPPRSVPLAYRVAALGLSPWEAFAVVLFVLAPMALWILQPHLRAAAFLVAALLVVATRVRRYARRVGVLRWGRVATVTRTDSQIASVTNHNVPMRQARGWDVTTQLYTGSSITTHISYLVDGQTGSIRIRGMPYLDGVVLADSRQPSRAMVVSQFPHSVRPGLDGQLVGRLAPGRWAWLLVTLALQAGLVVIAVQSVLDTWVR